MPSGCSVKAHSPGPATRSTALARGQTLTTLIESKARTNLNKSDVAIFYYKCFDLYRKAASEYLEQTADGEMVAPARVIGAN